MKRRYSIYLLPNLLTTAALFFGFFSAVSVLHMQFEGASIALFIAILLDGTDGRVARLVNAQSSFGAQYDSISDAISFGLVPALLIYQYSLFSLGVWGWLVAFIYIAAAALRLARFNVQHDDIGNRFFQGLPSPAAAALIASIVWVDNSYSLLISTMLPVFAAIVTMIASLLMVSNIRFYSFKQLDLKKRTLFVVSIFLMMLLVLIAVAPSLVLLLITFIYICSGLFVTSIAICRRDWGAGWVRHR